MILISKEESAYIRERAPHVEQVILNQNSNSKKKKYMVPESQSVLRMIAQYRRDNLNVLERHGAYKEPTEQHPRKRGRNRRNGK